MRDYSVSTLDSGVRVISERIEGVRSVAVGFWIGAGSRDEPPARAGVTHFIEHLLFKGSSRYTAQDIAERFDAMGGELNAATSRETTVVYTRVPDDRTEVAIDVMADMVFRPRFHDIDSEREVVLEEIAMVDDNPSDLVHDLASEAVFGDHPLGRPVIGSADVIGGVSKRALQAYHRGAYVGPNIVIAAAGNIDHRRLVKLLSKRVELEHRPLRPGSADTAAAGPAAPAVPAQGHRAVPRLSCSARHHPERRAQVRGHAPRLDRRRLGVVAAVPGDPREAGDGLLGLHVCGAVRGRRADRPLRRYARGEPARVHGDRGRRAPRRGRRRSARRARSTRAKENVKGRLLLSLESTSTRMTRLGKALATGVEIVSVEDTIERVEAVTAEDIVELAGELFAPEGLSAGGIGPSEKRFREAIERVNPGALVQAA